MTDVNAMTKAAAMLRKAGTDLGAGALKMIGKQDAFTEAYETAVQAGMADEDVAQVAKLSVIAGFLRIPFERAEALSSRDAKSERPEGWDKADASARKYVSTARKALAIAAPHAEVRVNAVNAGNVKSIADQVSAIEKKVEKLELPEDVPADVRRAAAIAFLDRASEAVAPVLSETEKDELQKLLEKACNIIKPE